MPDGAVPRQRLVTPSDRSASTGPTDEADERAAYAGMWLPAVATVGTLVSLLVTGLLIGRRKRAVS